MNKKVLRVIDANANRLTEGIRVCEDVTRFVLDDKAKTKDFKSLRHKASLSLKNLNGDIKILAKFRDVDRDIGRKSTKNEARRKGISDIFKANIKRSEESARVLEEFFKIANPRRSNIFKSIRFQLYSLEKNIVKKLQALCNY